MWIIIAFFAGMILGATIMALMGASKMADYEQRIYELEKEVT